MGIGKELTSEKMGMVAVLSLAGWDISEITRAVEQSGTAARSYLKKCTTTPNKRHETGRKLELSIRTQLPIRSTAYKKPVSPRKRKRKERLNISIYCKTVRLLLHKDN